MAKTTINAETIKTESIKSLFAAAGAAELAVVHTVNLATEQQGKATARLAEVQAQLEPKALQETAKARVEELAKDAKGLQARFEGIVADLRKDAAAYPTTVRAQFETAVADGFKTYAELAERGEKLYEAFRKDGVKAVTAIRKVAEDSAETLTELQKDSTVARRERAVVAADKKKTAAKKPAAKKAPAKKAAAKKAPAKKAAAKA
ncbi:MAG TPA: hypothetical protein PKL71_02315 [Marmoricola sp.]|nr:hypothetical protein [Marmoricola sp.]